MLTAEQVIDTYFLDNRCMLLEIAATLEAGLEAIGVRTGRVREIRARGLMMVLELQDDAEHSLAARTHRELVRRGFVVGRRPGVSALRLDPPLTIKQEDIEGFLQALEDVFTDADSGN